MIQVLRVQKESGHSEGVNGWQEVLERSPAAASGVPDLWATPGPQYPWLEQSDLRRRVNKTSIAGTHQ